MKTKARKPVNEWDRERFCREFFLSLDEFYDGWKAENNGRLLDWEMAVLRAKREGVLPHPAFAPKPSLGEKDGEAE